MMWKEDERQQEKSKMNKKTKQKDRPMQALQFLIYVKHKNSSFSFKNND